MSPLERSRFREINAIIERDSKETTCTFARLRAVIDLLQEYAYMKPAPIIAMSARADGPSDSTLLRY